MQTQLEHAALLWRTALSAVTAVALLWLAVLLSACGGGDDAPAPAPTEVSAVIGPAGGTLEGPDGARVVIPAGALSADTTITIARRDTGAPTVTPDGFTANGAVYEFTPHDILFKQPVTMRVPFSVNPQATAQDVLRASFGEPWTPLQVTPANGFAEWQSASFSWYWPMACATSTPILDPYWCTGIQGGTTLTATPGTALILQWTANGQRNYRATAASTLQLTTTFTAPPDCSDGRVDFKRRRPSEARTVVLASVPAARSAAPSGWARYTASFTVDLSAADNGATVLVATGSCHRAYQGPSRASLTPEQQRLSGFDAFVFDAQIALAPSFTQQPADQSVTEGTAATFAAGVDGALSLQWQLSTDGGANWSDIAGAIGASHTTAATAQGDNGRRYRVVASNSGGQTISRIAMLNVNPSAATAPQVTQQPVDQSVAPGATASFSAAFSGTPAPALQWQRSTDGGATWLDIAGAQASSFTTAPVAQGDDGQRYRLVGSNASGGLATNAARLKVVVPLSDTPEGKLALGGAHACAVMADYTVACWGMNNQGQLGNGGTSSASAPVAVSGLNQVIAVAVGSRGSLYSGNWGQSCAVQAGGGLWCWGRETNAVDQLVPQAVPGATNVRAVAVGSGHACYLDGSGHARCWGFNISGELGNGTFGNPQPIPAPVLLNGSTMDNVVAIGAGDMWTCALRTNGTVWCWGVDHTGNAEFNPQQIAGVSGATALSVGAVHACAIVTGGAVRCWGFGGNGELGDGGIVTSVGSVAVSGLTDVTAVAAGMSQFGGPGHTCARRGGGDVVCWGKANLGNGSTSSTVPAAAVTDLGSVTAVAAGAGATCALRIDGQVLCWGTNAFGQLGVGDTNDRAAPTATAAAASFWHP